MGSNRKAWLIFFGSLAGLIMMACSCGSLLPITSATANPPPVIVNEPAVTTTSEPGLAGKWFNPDSADSAGNAISTIQAQNGTFVVTSVINPASLDSKNVLTSSSWSNGVLTWSYCPFYSECITVNTVARNGDSLTVNWAWKGSTKSGTSVLQRQP